MLEEWKFDLIINQKAFVSILNLLDADGRKLSVIVAEMWLTVRKGGRKTQPAVPESYTERVKGSDGCIRPCKKKFEKLLIKIKSWINKRNMTAELKASPSN